MSPFSPSRAGHWRIRGRTLACPARPLLMGILNVTPDSFSDGGRFFDAAAAVAQGIELAAHGADLLDVGGESTRPYAQPVPVDEELRRVAPVVERLAREVAIPISIDTAKAAVAREAIDAGAAIINDITGLADPAMIETAAETGAGVCVMHMLGTPRSMQDAPVYGDVVAEVVRFSASGATPWSARAFRGIASRRTPGSGSERRPNTTSSCFATRRNCTPWGSPCSSGTRGNSSSVTCWPTSVPIAWPAQSARCCAGPFGRADSPRARRRASRARPCPVHRGRRLGAVGGGLEIGRRGARAFHLPPAHKMGGV